MNNSKPKPLALKSLPPITLRCEQILIQGNRKLYSYSEATESEINEEDQPTVTFICDRESEKIKGL